MKRLLCLVCLVAILGVSAPASAQDLEFGIERPRVFSIQPRPYVLGHEFTLGLGILPLDAFYVGMVVNASYTYHFTDFWSWEIVHANYSFNIDTSLEEELFDKYGVEPSFGGGERVNLFLTTNIVVKPLFGKLVLLNRSVVFSETFFMAGVGPFQSVSGTGEFSYFDPAASVGMGLRFWINDFFSARFEIRYYMVAKDVFSTADVLGRNEGGVKNFLLFNFSGSLNFATDDEVVPPSTEEAFSGQRAD